MAYLSTFPPAQKLLEDIHFTINVYWTSIMWTALDAGIIIAGNEVSIPETDLFVGVTVCIHWFFQLVFAHNKVNDIYIYYFCIQIPYWILLLFVRVLVALLFKKH